MDHSLDRLFLNQGIAAPATQDTFVNRTNEVAAFRRHYADVHSETSADPTDLATGRRNVLAFFGMGGIGKSTLSNVCETIAQRSEKETGIRPVTFRIDFNDPAFLDPETLLFALRAAVGSVPGVRTPAFDLALGSYWATKHPGEPIRTFLARSGWLAKVSRNDQLASDLSASIENLLGVSAIATASAKIGIRLVGALRRRIEAKTLLEECPLLEQILSGEDPDEVRMYLPYLLAWDLHRLDGDKRVAVTVFADTFEDVQERSRGLRDIEDVFARMVYLMPNVLFVISGRHRLRWASPALGQRLLFYGADRWPSLVENTAEAQILLGQLSDADATEYLHRRLRHLSLDASVLARIVGTSDGWPLYLDLQATQVERHVAKGLPMDAADFGGPLVEVVVRVMRDLDVWERDLLRAASLVNEVSRSLLRTILPEVLESRVTLFLSMSLLAGTDGVLGLNRALRESVPEADRELSDHWSTEQWEVVAKRVLGYYEEKLHGTDPAVVTAAFLDGCDIGARFDVQPSWLAVVAERLFAHGSWEVLRNPSTSERVRSSRMAPFASAAEAAALRATGETRASLELLRPLIGNPHGLSGEVHDYVAWQIVASSERSGEYDQAAQVCNEIGTPTFRARTLVRLGRLAWIASDLARATELAEEAGAEVAAAREHGGFAAELVAAPTVTYRNLLGWIRLTQGRFAEAEAFFRAALAEAEAQHEHFFVASEASHVALTLAFAGTPRAEPFVASAVERATQVGAVRQLAQARVADALVRQRSPGAALAELEQVRRDLRLAGDESDERLPLLGSVLVLVRAGRMSEAQQRALELAQLMDERLTHRCLGQIARSVAFPDADDATELVWGDDPSAVAARWRAAAGISA